MDDLKNNDEFVSTFIEASRIAAKNHQKEKLDALRNAVANVAMGCSIDDSKSELFLRFVDELTVLHLKSLTAFRDHDSKTYPQSRIRTSKREIVTRLQELLPGLQSEEALAEIVVDDLCSRGLLFWNRSGGGTYIKQGMNQVADMGAEFLKFITQPSSGT